jgi:hypothetical protein
VRTAIASSGPEEPTVTLDPTVTNPDHYQVVFENARVRVLEYADVPGDETTPHEHPDSVLVTLSSFDRRMYSGDGEPHDVHLTAGKVGWLSAQQHHAQNIGSTETHVIFVELKEGASARASAPASAPGSAIGPVGPAVG